MKIIYIKIKNYKSIRELEITDIENALILVGKNNTGKTSVIDALLLASDLKPAPSHEFLDISKPIDISIQIEFTEEDLNYYYSRGILCKSKSFEKWFEGFKERIPSYKDGIVSFTFHNNPNGTTRYNDGFNKHNPDIEKIIPKIYHIDQTRNLEALQNDVFSFYDKESFQKLKENECTFDPKRKCNRCFQCIGLINKKTPEELTLFETVRLLQFKLFHTNLREFERKVNEHFHINGSPSQEIRYELNYNIDNLLKVDTKVYNKERDKIVGSLNVLGEGLKSIYTLSLLEAYIDEENT